MFPDQTFSPVWFFFYSISWILLLLHPHHYLKAKGLAALMHLFQLFLSKASSSTKPLLSISTFTLLLHLILCLSLSLPCLTGSTQVFFTSSPSSILTTCPCHLSLDSLVSKSHTAFRYLMKEVIEHLIWH